ncbi:C-3',4' desaturase CrtD [Prochlorothrix hollandica]|uniref:Phytoene dehydrogenase n=1 Tax=Prochlorothrix hollandica PCC 9006 = CALU 1027 TaxID=317619 RepID=A0A0M2PYJ5_PROHO|nr:C-3',4' desaturase CrtD [Prochlorothrix hollandica]KKJ01506.1 phytoene dehydrogenase [Prochlorothrix hollandica PCC 9006 = CALU 1027]
MGASRLPQPSPQTPIIVIGSGIGGLTAAALLAHRGYPVTVLEQANVPGGCASTFQRRGFTFDVGATQVAGLEPGGIHHRIFTELGLEIPAATPCDPACAVYLPGETEPIQVWRDRQRWQQERQRQFPGSEPFWQFLTRLFEASWQFQSRDPIVPPRSPWDWGQLIQALRPSTLITVPHTLATVGDALDYYGLAADRRLRTFLDLQLKLYSQVDAAETALLYGSTALAVSQVPQGLWHLKGSMQVLSDRLTHALERDGGSLRLGQRVTGLVLAGDRVTGVTVLNTATGSTTTLAASQVVANVTAQNLTQLLPSSCPPFQGYRRRVQGLPAGSGAFVVYGGVTTAALPPQCPPHLQFLYDYDGPLGENNSLFVSVSQGEDGRAPAGCATIIASTFTDPHLWQDLDPRAYKQLKKQYLDQTLGRLGQFFTLNPETLRHSEAASPRTFAHYTARSQGLVGGIGQRVSTFGPFGLATRTPLPNLWLVGDSTHPGEGTAGVSYSALTVVRQMVRQMVG